MKEKEINYIPLVENYYFTADKDNYVLYRFERRNKIDIISNKDLQENFRRLSHIIVKSCLKVQELKDYLGYKNGYGWHISNLKIYDKPKELSEFEKNKVPQSWYYVEEVKQCKKN